MKKEFIIRKLLTVKKNEEEIKFQLKNAVILQEYT